MRRLYVLIVMSILLIAAWMSCGTTPGSNCKSGGRLYTTYKDNKSYKGCIITNTDCEDIISLQNWNEEGHESMIVWSCE